MCKNITVSDSLDDCTSTYRITKDIILSYSYGYRLIGNDILITNATRNVTKIPLFTIIYIYMPN